MTMKLVSKKLFLKKETLSSEQEHSKRLHSSISGSFGIQDNHVYLAAHTYRNHPKMQAFFDERLSTIKNDPYFLDDLFDIAMKIDRNEYDALLKNSTKKSGIKCPNGFGY